MKRRLIQQGLGGYTITVPIGWVREYHLQAGSEVSLEQVPSGVLISAQLAKREKAISLDLKNYGERMIIDLLNHTYRLGYDIINIKYSTPQQLHHIQEIVKSDLLGFELINHHKNQCELQNITEPDVEKFEVMLRKVFLFIKNLIENLDSVDLKEQKHQIYRLTNYCRRTIVRSKYGGEKGIFLYTILNNLSWISHAFIYSQEYCNKEKFIPNVKTMQMRKKIQELYEKLYLAFYNKDLASLEEIDVLHRKYTEEINSLLEKNKGKDNVLLSYYREAVRLLYLSTPSTIGFLLE